MPWIEVFAVFLVSHLVGDYLLQTENQATRKRNGLGRDPVARRALLSHVAMYTLAFVPALIWLGGEHSAGALALSALAIGAPHAVLDDGRAVAAWMRTVKKTEIKPGILAMMVDQTFHVLTLFALAVALGA